MDRIELKLFGMTFRADGLIAVLIVGLIAMVVLAHV